MARLAVFIALLAQLQPALAAFYTVTSYFILTETYSALISTCTESCRSYTFTNTLTVNPTVTPTAKPLSATTRQYTYDDLEVVSVYLAASAVASSDILPSRTVSSRTSGAGYIFTNYAVPITYTAPTSCPTAFTVTTLTRVDVPYQVTPYITGVTTTSLYINTRTPSTDTYITVILDRTAVPSTEIGVATTGYLYTYYIANCRNPTATGAAYYGPTATGYHSGGSSSSGGSDDDYTVCSTLTGCVSLATWIIVVATILPLIFLLGFVESYCWFRRMMLGKSALRLGTVCWCALSLWFILLTRKSPSRSVEDQALLKQYWKTLSAGTRIKLWFKWGFRWQYPVELLGNQDGSPVVVAAAAVPPPANGGPPGGPDGEKNGVIPQMQPVYAPYPGQQPYPGQPPYPGQQPYPMPGQPMQFQPGFAPPPGYMMVPVPQGAYVPGQQPGFAPTPPPLGAEGQQYPPYGAPSPVQTATTEVPSVTQPTPPPGHEYQQPPPGAQQPATTQQPHQQPPQQPPQELPSH